MKGSVDPKGSWIALFSETTVIAWNPEKLKADGLRPPASLADLGKPEWRGKIGLDDAAFNWYQAVLLTQKDAAADRSSASRITIRCYERPQRTSRSCRTASST